MDEKEAKENAEGYVKDAIAVTEDAFRWTFCAGDYESAKLVFEALDSLKIAHENLSESERMWKRESTRKEAIDALRKAERLAGEALSLLERS